MTLIANSKVWALACELNVVHHCNLACRACSHRAPEASPYFASPDRVFRDLSNLARNYHCSYVRLVGGEPLLHPAVLEVAEAVVRSGIADHVRIHTNGTLLSRVSNRFWAAVDQVHVSTYPGFEQSRAEIEGWKRKAAEHHAALKISSISTFRETYSEQGTLNTRLIRHIYSTCRQAHLWHCHTVSEGYFFKCPESWVLAGMPQADGTKSHPRDGLRISEQKTFLRELAGYLSSSEPLDACQHCLGCAGKAFAHNQAGRRSARAPQSTEELIDWGRLWQLRATRLPRTWVFRAERLFDAKRSRVREML
jgi:GTP 3',8-cyclase